MFHLLTFIILCFFISFPFVSPFFLFSPLARNLLAKKQEAPPDDWRASLPRYSKENWEKNQKLAGTVQELSEKYHCTAAQLSLAWLFHKAKELGVTVVPIPGTTKIDNALSNFQSVNVTISAEDSNILEGLANQVAGERYEESFMSASIENQK